MRPPGRAPGGRSRVRRGAAGAVPPGGAVSTTVLSEIIPGWDLGADAVHERLDPSCWRARTATASARHEGQTRSSGEPYVSHCVEVAKILADLQLDSTTVAAGLIHDVVEDTTITVEDVEREFGAEVAQIVDGLTKIGNLPMHSKEERQVENYRKLLLSVAKDARVILIKLADRLHNMRTLDYLPPEKRRRIAQETRDLYGPLAHRFGMAKVRWELEDLAFKHLEPEEYRALAKLVATKRGEREALIAQLREPLERQLRQAKIEVTEVTGRPKHLWSIYKKMKQRDKPYEDIYDLLAIRVMVGSVPECYHALGVIHEWWTPLQERIKDYIAQPKSNGYQSLHTTVFGPASSCSRCRSARATCIARRTTASPRTGATRRRPPRTATTSIATSRGSGRCSSCSSTPRTRTSSWSSSSSTCTRTRSSSSPRRATSSSCPRGRRRSTSRSPCTRRWGSTAPGRRSTARSRRSPAS
jgi:hypothetical protein